MQIGSVEKALFVHGKENIFEEIKQTFTNIDKMDMIDLLNKKDVIFKDKDNIFEILDYINTILLKKSNENIKYINGIETIEDTKNRLNRNSNYDMSIDNLLFKLWEEING